MFYHTKLKFHNFIDVTILKMSKVLGFYVTAFFFIAEASSVVIYYVMYINIVHAN